MEFHNIYGALIICCLCLSSYQVVRCDSLSTEGASTEETSTTQSNTSTAQSTSSSESPITISEPVTSEAATTTETPPPTVPTTAPAVPKHYEAKDGNITCLVMDATFVFNIPYIKKDDSKAEARVPVPEDATSEGQCTSNRTEQLEIFFFETPKRWKFVIDIATEKNREETSLLMAEDNVKYSWREIALTYYVDEKHFPDAKEVSDQPITVSATNLTHQFEASNKGSYKCVQSQKVDMNDDVTLAVSEFHYRAFGTTTDDNYPDSGLEECAADKKKDDDDDTGKIVGIVVGSVVGAIIILTIVGCLIQRARRRGSYEKV